MAPSPGDARGLRQSAGSMAIVGRAAGGRAEWLARWNKKWESYAFVGGHLHDGETFRECLVRELAEELELDEHDFTVGDAPLARLEFVDWSESAQQDTAYTHELFAVAFANDAVIERLRRDTRLRWLTDEEIRNQHGADGSPVSPTLSRYLDSIGWRPPFANIYPV